MWQEFRLLEHPGRPGGLFCPHPCNIVFLYPILSGGRWASLRPGAFAMNYPEKHSGRDRMPLPWESVLRASPAAFFFEEE